MKNFCESLRKRAIEIINSGKIPLVKEEREFHGKSKICYICKEKSIEN